MGDIIWDTRGILYIVYDGGGEVPYVDEARNSIISLRKHTKLPITVYTDKNITNFDFENVKIIKKNTNSLIPQEAKRDPYKRGNTMKKLFLLKELPYDSTIFVDTDTVFYDDPSQLISNDYDLAICRETHFRKPHKGTLQKKLNTGFFIVHKGEIYNRLMNKAIDIYKNSTKKMPVSADQIVINEALGHMLDINIRILPQKWNVRPPLLGKVGDMKLFHGRGEVVELVYTTDLKSVGGPSHAGSSPAFATKTKKRDFSRNEKSN